MDYKKKLQSRLYLAAAYMAIGLVLTIVAFVAKTDNDFIPFFGIGLIANAILRFRQYRRITKDESTIKQQEIAEKDERNLMLLEKARSWAFGFYIWFTSKVLIVFAILGVHETLVQMSSYSICLMVLIYWICYYILKRKY